MMLQLAEVICVTNEIVSAPVDASFTLPFVDQDTGVTGFKTSLLHVVDASNLTDCATVNLKYAAALAPAQALVASDEYAPNVDLFTSVISDLPQSEAPVVAF
ncbi:unnamed protein product [Cuscuta epithymum]|uniref:Uncharacterized protein n=1 Tax=Cuscuta epithymum TaxID=186058 RepID=A0AAV0DV40_9ASTE|nr:unnamed protein product [Cuscuta epithymum]CAH9110348.1 unnamed protein product [Cuscuta epithymum]CAH9145445.1 unnamed protein product [Cuscuta epithymum]